MLSLIQKNYKKFSLLILWIWFALSLYPAYGEYLTSLKKIRNYNEEHINVYFVSTVISKLEPVHEEPILVILPGGLSVDERWFYHYRIRYKLYPQKIDFAEILPGGTLKKVSYDYKKYKKELPVSLDLSNLLPLKKTDYTYIITIAGARAILPGFTIITNAPDVKAVVYKRTTL